MADRFKYAKVRQEIINALRTDLMGPQSDNEVLDESPKSAYIIGMIASQVIGKDTFTAGEQEVEADIAYGDSENYTADEDDDNDSVTTTSFKLPTSIGISFYIASSIKSIGVDVSWGDYVCSVNKRISKEGNEYSHVSFTRQPMKSRLCIDFTSFEKNAEYRLVEDSNINPVSKFYYQGTGFADICSGGVALHNNLAEHLTKEQYRKLMDVAVKAGCNYFT